MKSLQDLKGILYQLKNNYDLKELTPKKDSRKSFYKKAYYTKISIDTNLIYKNIILLYSYNTLVLAICYNDTKKQYFLNDGRIWSNTTLRHIKEALHQFINIDYSKSDIIKNDGIIL